MPIVYHDDLEGSLISTADKIVDLIYLKYLKANITYEHDRRVETYPFAGTPSVKRFTTPSLTTVICTVLRYRFGSRKSRLL